jgi:hypothetical protein
VPLFSAVQIVEIEMIVDLLYHQAFALVYRKDACISREFLAV